MAQRRPHPARPGQLADAARVMSDYDVHHLAVTAGRQPRPVGILSTLDVAGTIAWARG